jgi:PAS domain-containing protein
VSGAAKASIGSITAHRSSGSGSFTDVTPRKEAEEELARKEAQLRIAMDNMPGGMFMVDENLVIQVFNEQYKEMYDYPDAAVREGVSLAEAVRVRAERGD